MYKGFLLASNGIRHHIIQLLGCHQVTRDSYESNPIPANMWFIVFLAAFVCGVCCNENLPTQLILHSKDKRGINDHPLIFPSESSSSYSAPGAHGSLSSGYSLGGSSGGFSLSHAGPAFSHGIGYSLASSGGLGFGSGYQSPGLGSHGSLNHQSISTLGGHSAQSTYSVPAITSAHLGSGGSGNGLFTPAKTGPVTFGIHGGGSGGASTSGSGSYSAPSYTSGSHGLSAYGNGGASSAGLQIVLGSQHGLPLGSSGSSSSYSLPIHSSSPSHSVTGGLVIASGSHSGSQGGSSSYSLPASSHSISTLGSSSGGHGSSSYTLPISSGSHGISALSSTSSSYPGSSGSYGSSSGHSSGFSSGSSSYELPTSGSYSSSGSSNSISYMNYVPSHSSGSSSSYSSPITYAAPSSSHVDSSSYSGAGSGYSLSSNHAGSSSSPIVSYAGSSSYTPMYYSPSGSQGASDSHGAYASVSPRYLGYAPGAKLYDSGNLGSAKYDTISYSVPNGKY